jgi:SAM-dependent methyltransferase
MNFSGIYNACQFILEGDYHNIITQTVGASTDERLLDIGSGTGYFSQFFNCRYVGIDSNPAYVAAASKQYANPARTFNVMDATRIDFSEQSFDKIVLINFIHHLSNADVLSILRKARYIARDKIFIFDMNTKKMSAITPLLLKLDNGRFIRNAEEQSRLIGSVLSIEDSFNFVTPRRLLEHTAFVCS